MLRLAEAKLSVDNDDARVTARIGISSCQRAGTKGEHVLQLADDALCATKLAGPLKQADHVLSALDVVEDSLQSEQAYLRPSGHGA